MQSAINRRLEMIKYLCTVRSTTRTILKYRFSISLSTVDRDIMILSCSHPILTKPGNGGGVFIEKGYYLYKEYLTEKQKNLLVQLKSTVDIDDANTLESIIEKFGRR